MEKVLISRIPIILLPLLLVTGPFLPDLVLSLSSIFFLTIVTLNKNFKYLKNKYFLFFFIFWVFITLNSIYSGSLISMKSSFSYIRFGIFLLVFLYIFENYEGFFKNLKFVILFSLIILFIDSLIQYFYGQNILGYPRDSRISSFFGDEKILGSYIVKLVPILISLYFFVKKKTTLDFKVLIILLGSLLLILLSNERSALGLYILYLFLLSLIFYKDFKRLLVYGLAIIIFLTTIILNSESIYNRYVVALIDQFKVTKDQNTNTSKQFYYFTEAHDNLFYAAFKMFKEKPLIGHGTKNFRIKCNDEKYHRIYLDNNINLACNTHPHNFYIQILAENGILGFISLLTIFLYFLYFFIKNIFAKNKKQILNLIIASNVVILWPIVPHGDFFNNWLSIIIFLNFSIFVCFKKYFEDKKVYKN